MPPLRDRREDILPFAVHYLRFFERQQGRSHLSFAERCQVGITNYGWPGNLRELRNAVERAVILSPASVLELQDLGLEAEAAGLVDQSPAGPSGSPNGSLPALGHDFSVEQIEREHIAQVVARASSFEAAAQVLGIDPTTLQRKRKRYGLA